MPSPNALLLTPGPLTTSPTVKRAMQHVWGSRDQQFINMNQRVRTQLLQIAKASEQHVCVPIQGSGTFAIAATLGTLIGPNDKALVLINGAYGQRMVKILNYHGRDHVVLETSEDEPVNAAAISALLSEDTQISHVLAVHCETTTEILNPIEDIAATVQAYGRALIIDSMSGFGALELNAQQVQFAALVASSNKCVEGVPGLGFALIEQRTLAASRGNAPAFSLDLHDQWQAMEGNGQWRFTPPTHVIAALD